MPKLPRSPFNRPKSRDQRVIDACIKEMGVKEDAGEQNHGACEKYLAAVGLEPGNPWCAAFVYWVFDQLRGNGDDNPCPKTGGALKIFEEAPAQARVTVPHPGCVFVVDHGKGKGHCGFVEDYFEATGEIQSIEGNTNQAGSREGNSVARHKWNPAAGKRGKLVGYLDLNSLI